MNKKQSSISTLVAIGVGAAVFFILGRFLSIPTVFQIQVLKQPIPS